MEKTKIVYGFILCRYQLLCVIRGGEGLILDSDTLRKNYENGNYDSLDPISKSIPPHVIIPLRGRFKGETGERCHLVPLPAKTSSGVRIREAARLLIAARSEMYCRYSPWAFVHKEGDF